MLRQVKQQKLKKEEQPYSRTLQDLHTTAQSRYASFNKAASRAVWIKWIGLALILVLTIFVSFSVLAGKNQNDQLESLQLEDFVKQFIQAAGNSAANLVIFGPVTEPVGSEVFVEAQLLPVSEPEQPITLTFLPLVSSGGMICRQQEEISIELISGPDLDPPRNSKYNADQVPNATATWVIKNIGKCSWTSLSLFSLHDGAMLTPVIQRDGKKIIPNEELVLAMPGGSLELITTFDGKQAKDISKEWVFVINKHQAFSQPHLILNVNRWIIVQEPPPQERSSGSTSPNSTPEAKNPADNPTDSTVPNPPSRSIPTPPSRP